MHWQKSSERRVQVRQSLLTATWNTVLSSILGLVIAIFVTAVLTGTKVPFVSGDRANFIVLAVLGIVLCIKGNSHSALMFGWTNPQYWAHSISVVGMGLGVLALLLVAFTLGDINIPLFSGYKTAFPILAIIIFIKLGLKILQNRIINNKT
jgi:peptidoglycan/LPS O-acetylase OafA/YrhL